VIRVSGFTVSPAEIEQIMMNHPAVKEVAVVGKKHPKKGEVPVAFVALEADKVGTITPEEMTAWAAEKISGFKVPYKIVFKKEIPKIMGLKVDRKLLAKEAETIS
jgi:acyl-coenzyme A synthetase/AMP-(fatty) acid ligase